MNAIKFVGEHAQTYEVHKHTHEYWEFVYCTGGQGTFYFENGTTLTYREGDAVAIPPHEIHSNVSESGFTNIHIRIDASSFPYRAPFRVTDDEEQHLKSTFTQIQYYYLADIKRSELVLNALGELISSYLIVYRSNSEFSEPVEQIRSMILRNYAEPEFALDEAIRSMPFHYDYLRKLFKKEMGVTPLEYMTRLRMKKAEIMMTTMWTKDYSMSEIAKLCGYEDALYFSRVFKKHFGCSPTVFVGENAEKDHK